MHRQWTLAAFLTLAACAGAQDDAQNDAGPANVGVEAPVPAPAPVSEPPPVANEAATEPEVVSEEPFTPDSAQGAANVVQTYFALLEAGKFAEARALWSDGGKASGMSEELFAQSMSKYQEYHAEVGAPGRIEGAAGSLYVEVPVRVYGVARGEPFDMEGPVTLRRCNNVPGCTKEQLQWHISDIGVRPRPEQ